MDVTLIYSETGTILCAEINKHLIYPRKAELPREFLRRVKAEVSQTPGRR